MMKKWPMRLIVPRQPGHCCLFCSSLLSLGCLSVFVPPAALLPVDMVSRENNLLPVWVAKIVDFQPEHKLGGAMNGALKKCGLPGNHPLFDGVISFVIAMRRVNLCFLCNSAPV